MVPTSSLPRLRKPFPWDYASQPKEHVEKCNACGSTFWVTLCDRDRYGFSVTSHCCHSCGLVFLSPRMTAEAYAEFYRKTYRDLIQWHSPGTSQVSEDSQRRYADKIIPLLEPFVREGGTALLDIGGAPGACAHAVSSHFNMPHYAVVDPAQESALYGKSFEEWRPDGKWDLVLCCQTVDHLLDLRGGLEKMRNLLTDDGVLWVDILDWLYMLRRRQSVRAIIKMDHPYSLNEVTFLLLLAEVGLEPVRLVYQVRHIGFVCKKATPVPGILMEQGHKNPILANARKKEAESKWTSAVGR